MSAVEVPADAGFVFRRVIAEWLRGLVRPDGYRRPLAQFAAWVEAKDDPMESAAQMLCSLTASGASELVRRWRDALLESGLRKSTAIQYVTAITSLVTACRRAGLVAWKLEGVQLPCEPRGRPRGLSRSDIERLITVVDEQAIRDPQACRDAAVIHCMSRGATREVGLQGLTVSDYDANKWELRVLKWGATGEHETLILSSSAAAAIDRWLDLRGRQPGPLFCRLDRADTSKPLSGSSIARLLAAWSKKAGLRRAVKPHDLNVIGYHAGEIGEGHLTHAFDAAVDKVLATPRPRNISEELRQKLTRLFALTRTLLQSDGT